MRSRNFIEISDFNEENCSISLLVELEKTHLYQRGVHGRGLSSSTHAASVITDTRPEALHHQQEMEAAANSPRVTVQRKAFGEAISGDKMEAPPNDTGMPNGLKTGIENISGIDLSDVKVHYNSAKPGSINAHAYAAGTDIYLSTGQEKHLPHEAWHVVQQKQRRVKPMLQLKSGVYLNNNAALEKEADEMGMNALQHLHLPSSRPMRRRVPANKNGVVQAKLIVKEWIDEKKEDNKKSTKKGYRKDNQLTQLQKRSITNHPKASGYQATAMTFPYVELLMVDDVPRSMSLEQLVAHLIAENHLKMGDAKHGGGSANPNVVNPMPGNKSTFSPSTSEAVELQSGEHRRHIIGRHTLGRACGPRNQDEDKDIKAFVNKYGKHSREQVSKMTRADALAEAYYIMQDHVGNLWPGDGGQNTAIGFFTGDIFNWMNKLLDKHAKVINGQSYTYLEQARASLLEISNFKFTLEHLGMLKHVVLGTIENIARQDPIEDAQKGPMVNLDVLIPAMEEIAYNCELDLPDASGKGYNDLNQVAIDLIERFKSSNRIFSGSDGTAEKFMQHLRVDKIRSGTLTDGSMDLKDDVNNSQTSSSSNNNSGGKTPADLTAGAHEPHTLRKGSELPPVSISGAQGSGAFTGPLPMELNKASSVEASVDMDLYSDVKDAPAASASQKPQHSQALHQARNSGGSGKSGNTGMEYKRGAPSMDNSPEHLNPPGSRPCTIPFFQTPSHNALKLNLDASTPFVVEDKNSTATFIKIKIVESKQLGVPTNTIGYVARADLITMGILPGNTNPAKSNSKAMEEGQ